MCINVILQFIKTKIFSNYIKMSIIINETKNGENIHLSLVNFLIMIFISYNTIIVIF